MLLLSLAQSPVINNQLLLVISYSSVNGTNKNDKIQFNFLGYLQCIYNTGNGMQPGKECIASVLGLDEFLYYLSEGSVKFVH